jgi:pimeloyl-ACP methyl ester carboxylesterase
MFARAAGRVARCSSGVSVLQGTCHPPLAAGTPQRSPRRWRDSDAQDDPAASNEGLPLFLFCHANGFCKEVWRPVVEELSKVARAPFRWIALDFSGHGDTAKAVPASGRWEEFAVDDIVSVLKEFQGDSRYVVGIGHSLGGAGLLLTEATHKGAFDLLALFEPVVLPHPDDLQRLTGLTEQQWVGYMQKNALKRRNDFADLSEISKYMKSRKAFQVGKQFRCGLSQ